MADELDNIIDDVLSDVGGEKPSDFDFPWAETNEQKCRAYIFDRMLEPELDARIQVKNCDIYYQWIMTGTLPIENAKIHKLTKE